VALTSDNINRYSNFYLIKINKENLVFTLEWFDFFATPNQEAYDKFVEMLANFKFTK